MERKKTLTMNWDALGDNDDDDDRFFETYDRLSCAVPLDLASSGSDDDDEFQDPRMSFASVTSSVSTNYAATTAPMSPDYDIWMAAPGSINERRKRLLQGMGLSADKELISISRKDMARPVSKRIDPPIPPAPVVNGQVCNSSEIKINKLDDNNIHINGVMNKPDQVHSPSASPSPSASSFPTAVELVRSRSDSDIESLSVEKKRKVDLLGGFPTKQRLTRTSSMIIVSQYARVIPYKGSVRIANRKSGRGGGEGEGGTGRPIAHSGALTSILSDNTFGAFFLIKNLDTGKEFVVNESDRLSDLQTGKQLTMEEFEKCVGHSPVVKELMRRENVSRTSNGMDEEGERKNLGVAGANSYLSKSIRMSKRRGAALLKNIKGVAHSMSMTGSKSTTNSTDHQVRENDDNNYNNNAATTPPPPPPGPPPPSSQNNKQQNASGNVAANSSCGWIKVRQTGKSYKELSALHLCQEVQAHQGSIWTIKFSSDARFLASGGEDKVIHIWEVQECEIMSLQEGNTQLPPSLITNCSSIPTASNQQGEAASDNKSKKKKKGSTSSSSSSNRKGGDHKIPDYVHVPETVFSLSDKPVCSFTGHLDDVLDLSWSRSQQLLSSSMDKTVRLWDMETKSCLKLFAHNDYVTCIQFNPIDDNYFISGSLDAKVRIWSVPDRQLVDWTDLHEMVTAVCYTPDGQGALIGSHKGSYRMYSAEDCKLDQEYVIDVQNKKRSQAKKITGFQFSTGNPSEVLVTSADSRIRILDGSEVVHKFRGFRNINSQISASFSMDGKYVICASEDSHVFVWKLEDQHRAGGKGKNGITTTRSHESFPCKDVSVAIPWPGTIKGDPPPGPQPHSKRNSKRSSSAAPTSQPTSSTCGSPTKDDGNGDTTSKTPPSEADHDHHNNNIVNNTTKTAAAAEVEDIASSDQQTRSEESNSQVFISKRQLPPLPKKSNNSHNNVGEDGSQISRSNSSSGVDHSFSSSNSSSSPSIRYGDSPSVSSGAASTPSSSWSYSWSWFDGGNHGNHASQATAWGLVIVTATLGGEIRTYQNFGLPRRIGRQTNLF